MAAQPHQSASGPGENPGLCPRHGAPLVWFPAGRGWWVCRHCLEPVCEACEEPVTLCVCEATS